MSLTLSLISGGDGSYQLSHRFLLAAGKKVNLRRRAVRLGLRPCLIDPPGDDYHVHPKRAGNCGHVRGVRASFPVNHA